MSFPQAGVGRGALCWATVPAGVGHDQGTRPWLVVSRAGLPRAIALPVSSVEPDFGYPLSWPAPHAWGLPEPSWVLIDHIRSLPANRLRDQFAEASRAELLEVLHAVAELLGAERGSR